jgi:GDP-mannose 6-dehydrogenase
MRIAVFGLGYAGSVTAAMLAERGHTVVGIDSNRTKVELIASGSSPIAEPGLSERIASGVENGYLQATSDPALATDWEVAFVCVATPSGEGGKQDTSALVVVLSQIGRALREQNQYAVVAIRSTIHPRLMADFVIPTLTKASGKAPGETYGLVVMPEFLREGRAVSDFLDPALTIIGVSEARAGNVIHELFEFISAPIIRLSIGEAMMVKYASNAYHALKVAFANEIDQLCRREGLDSRKVMGTVCRDTKLNVSRQYLSPGFAFGGSCLTKDVRLLNHFVHQDGMTTPVLDAILPSNQSHLKACIDTVLASNCQKIGVLGLTFKPGTDDLRESPMVIMIKALMEAGREIRIYDSNVKISRLLGSNRDYIETMIPNIASLQRSSVEEVVDAAQVVIVGYCDPAFDRVEAIMREDQKLIDFGRSMSTAGLRQRSGAGAIQ